MEACGTRAPDWSATVPRIEPLAESWPNNGVEVQIKRTTKEAVRRRVSVRLASIRAPLSARYARREDEALVNRTGASNGCGGGPEGAVLPSAAGKLLRKKETQPCIALEVGVLL